MPTLELKDKPSMDGYDTTVNRLDAGTISESNVSLMMESSTVGAEVSA